MGILYVFAIYLGRQNTAHISLFASAFFMTLWNPLMLWDVGFQLSFSATVGLILFTPSIRAALQRACGALVGCRARAASDRLSE